MRTWQPNDLSMKQYPEKARTTYRALLLGFSEIYYLYIYTFFLNFVNIVFIYQGVDNISQ